MNLGPFGLWEIIIVVAVVVLLFGAGSLPKIAKGAAKTFKNVRKEVRELKDDIDITK
ncbi:hypothetical protein BH24DEI2_BH24DEI2_07420 [soil metagenome]